MIRPVAASAAAALCPRTAARLPSHARHVQCRVPSAQCPVPSALSNGSGVGLNLCFYCVFESCTHAITNLLVIYNCVIYTIVEAGTRVYRVPFDCSYGMYVSNQEIAYFCLINVSWKSLALVEIILDNLVFVRGMGCKTLIPVKTTGLKL